MDGLQWKTLILMDDLGGRHRFLETPIFFLGGELYERWGGEEIVELVMYLFVWKPCFSRKRRRVLGWYRAELFFSMKGSPQLHRKRHYKKAIRVGHDTGAGRDVYFVAHLCSAIQKVSTKKKSDKQHCARPIRKKHCTAQVAVHLLPEAEATARSTTRKRNALPVVRLPQPTVLPSILIQTEWKHGYCFYMMRSSTMDQLRGRGAAWSICKYES